MGHADDRNAAPYSAPPVGGRARNWTSAMSDNVATALLVYTALQIFFTMKALADAIPYSVMPYLGLVVLVGLVIPFLRGFEKRWTALPGAAQGDPALRGAFRRDQLLLWALAIAFPLLLTVIVKYLLGEG